jgi:chromosome segregation ATPase
VEVTGSEQSSGALVAKPSRGVRQGDVDKAADSILARGQRPTVERIRQVLGTGSPNTLGPLIDNWYRSLSARVSGMQHAAGAEGRAPTAAINAFNLLWDTALAEARNACQTELASERDELSRVRVQNAEDQRVLEATRAALEQAAQAARDRIRELEEQVVAGQLQLRRSQQEAAAAVERVGQLQQELAQAHRDLKAQAAAHDAQRQREAERTTTNERRMLADVDRVRGEARAALEEARRANAERDDQKRAAGELREQMHSRAAELTRTIINRDTEIIRLKTVLENAAEIEAGLRELVATAQARTRDLNSALDSERASTERLRQLLEGRGRARRAQSAGLALPNKRPAGPRKS